MSRRTVSRMIERMRAAGLIVTRRSASDRRAVEITFSDGGRDRLAILRTEIVTFFVASRAIAREIGEGLGGQTPSRTNVVHAEPLTLLYRVCASGLALVRAMPDSARHGHMAARQRAALVHLVMTGGARPQALSEGLEVSRAAVAYIVDQLCAKGFASRRHGVIPDDRRAVIVQATPECREVVQSVLNGIEHQRESLAALFCELATWRPPAGTGTQSNSRGQHPNHRPPANATSDVASTTG